uniref:Uncharacterized protein n=1 Tax=viral metagenome TaxID=1070528 RepID=A0A6C0HXS9_9ZZZZ
MAALRDERYERYVNRAQERVSMEERDRRASQRGKVRDRINEFMRKEDAVAREREDAARIEKEEREFNELKLTAAKNNLQKSIDDAITKRREEIASARQMHEAALSKPKRQETESFTLSPENCNSDFRNVVVLPVPRGKRWYADNIGFFQSTARSNGPSFSHLRDTYLPTLGVLDATGKYNPADERVPGLEELEGGGDIIIKTGLFKGIFECKPPPGTAGQPPIPKWIDELLTEYCSLTYPALITRDFYRPIVNKEDYDESESEAFFDSLQEMYQLFDLCRHYFSDVWQIAMSIGLSEHFRTGVWVADGNDARKFFGFKDFINSKFKYDVTGHKGAFNNGISLRVFLQQQRAQSDFHFPPLPCVQISQPKNFLFTGRSVQSLSVPLRTYKSLNPLEFKPPKKEGGTRRKRRSIKTRRQKRR